jgi:TPR repeat protein
VAIAKLSGSLLAYRDVPPAPTPAQPLSPAGIMSADQASANRFEGAESELDVSNSTDGSVSARTVAAAERLGSSSLATVDNHRLGPLVRFSLGLCGAAALTAIGMDLFIHATGHSVATIASPTIPGPTTVSSPAPANLVLAPPAEPQVVGSGSGTPVTSARAESFIALAISSAPTNPAATANQPPAAVAASPAPAPIAPAAGAHLLPEEVTALLARADALLGSGDIVSARLCYERAAEGGDAQAALRLGETYDPAFLARAHLNGVRGDTTAATQWYRYALSLGATEAQTLLTAVAANDDAAKRSKEMNQLFEQFLARRDGQTH